MSAGLLFSQMQPPAGWEDDFHDWYETEHIPQRMAIPGFHSAVRYELTGHEGGPAAARWLACYFVDDMAALETPAYHALKQSPGDRTRRMLDNVDGFTRYIADEISDTGATDETPQAMLIDEVEAIWSAIAERDDWRPLHDKVAAIRRMGDALGEPPTPAGHNPDPVHWCG